MNIYGQAAGTGTLTATDGYNQACIGTNVHGDGGKLVINGGTVNAKAGYSAAGIGGCAQDYWACESNDNEGAAGTLDLGWREQTDWIYMSSVKANVTLNAKFINLDTHEEMPAESPSRFTKRKAT